MTPDFPTLAAAAREGDPSFADVPRSACVAAARAYMEARWAAVRERHSAAGPAHNKPSAESGSNVLRLLTDAADMLVSGIAGFGLYHTRRADAVLSRVALCALGGYGRRELSPHSDLDICLIYDGALDRDVQALSEYLHPFIWDMGFRAGFTLHGIEEAAELSLRDPQVFTSLLQARLLLGDPSVFVRLRQALDALRRQVTGPVLAHVRKREDAAGLGANGDLYNPEPDIKENVGGLRDYHAAYWMISLFHGPIDLDEMERMGLISPDEHLELLEALDFLWRIRNELHFHARKAQDRLTFAAQKHVAGAFGYGEGQRAIDRFMRDYFNAARRVRAFLRIAARLSDHQLELDMPASDASATGWSGVIVRNNQISAGLDDPNWFRENPARLMEIFWESARRQLPLSPAMERFVAANLDLVGDEFRTNDVVRRFFVALCSRPLAAGMALRQAAQSGFLGAYLPEFAAIHGIVRYEDFHSYPVDEHTLRAVEALAGIPRMEGIIGRSLQHHLEHIREPHILVLGILAHDLGKALGEEHVQEGVRIVRQIAARIGLSDDDASSIAFLVEHHMLMTHLSMYRDTDDMHIVNSFAETMRTDERLRQLLLLSYADLTAVGPEVWTEWKGALLLRLYLKAERILRGQSDVDAEQKDFWIASKAESVRALLPESLHAEVEPLLRGLGERYAIGFPAESIARHVECITEARIAGLALRCDPHKGTPMSEVVICTRDRHGLIAELAGGFASQLADVNAAALFTTPDGYVVDVFVVTDAANHRPLTDNQVEGVERVLRAVVLDGADIQEFVDRARRRLFALLQPRAPVRPRIEFDNESSLSGSVIDIETGDRTGLLYDITRALAQIGVDVQSARIVTDGRRVRDAFYVRMNNTKIRDAADQARVLETLEAAIRSGAGTEPALGGSATKGAGS